MRKVVLYQLLSVDGVAESPDTYISDFDEEMYANLKRVIDTQDAVLLGRRTYDDWVGYWPTSDHEPFASFINSVQKYIVTSTTPQESWANSTVVEGPLRQFVVDLKKQPGGDIGIHGSIGLARFLLQADLVDELRLVIAPTVSGSGRKLMDGELKLRKLELLRSTGTPTHALLVDYRVLHAA